MAKATDWGWDQMLADFRALGGGAENICVKSGEHGRGLFPLDPSKPVNLYVPENLLLKVGDVQYDNGTMRLKKESEAGAKEKEFFEKYQANFGWGAGGREDCTAFIEALDSLPGEIRDLLAKDFGLATLFRGDKVNRVEHRFLKSRMIGSKGRYVLMPVIELVNHGSKGVSFQYKNGISVTGTFPDEILVHYFDATDPFTVFSTWGFAHPESVAFSLVMNMPLSNKRLQINRALQEKGKLGDARAPIVKITDKAITLSHLMLGSAKFPRLAKGVFYRIMKDLKEPNAEELFDRIQHFNRMKFLQLQEALEPHDGEMVRTLRKVATYQLEAMSHAVGVREIAG
jgi:hypothetical protein